MSTALLVAMVVVLAGVPAFAVVRALVLDGQAVVASGGAGAVGNAPGPRLELSDAILSAKGPAWGLIWTSLAWACGITLLATVLGTLAALGLRGRWGRWGRWGGWGPMVVVPMALPNYLAYWAFGQLRAPGTWMGDAIEHAVTSGQTWVPMLVGRMVAVFGLSLWAWPIVALAAGAALARVPGDVCDAMRLEMGPMRLAAMEVRLAWRGVVGGAGLVLLVMMGSAVPLHLAQVPTMSLAAWQVLSLTPGSAAAWVALWPVLLPSAVAAGWIGVRAVRVGAFGRIEKDNGAEGARWGRRGVWMAAGLLVLSVPLPLGAMLLTIREFTVFQRFGWEMGDATRTSLGVAVWVGAGCAMVALVTARALGGGGSGGGGGLGGDRRVGWVGRARAVHAAAVGVLVFMVLAPGLLVGSAWTHAFAIPSDAAGLGWVREIGQTHWALVLAHLSRFAGLAALAGAGIAWLDARGAREVRAMDGATGAWAWLVGGGVMGSLARGVVGCGAVGVLGAVLSFHEIEATVMVQPPGLTTVAQVVLGYLHFSRLQEMSVAGVYLIGGACVIAMLAGLGLGWGARVSGGGGGRRSVRR